MVEFQPWIVTPPQLVSVAFCYTSMQPFCPIFLFYRFMDGLPPPLTYRPPIRVSSSPKPSHFNPLPNSSLVAKRRPPGRHPHLPPTSLCRLSLRPAPRDCFCHRFPLRCASPLSALDLHPGPCVGLLFSGYCGNIQRYY